MHWKWIIFPEHASLAGRLHACQIQQPCRPHFAYKYVSCLIIYVCCYELPLPCNQTNWGLSHHVTLPSNQWKLIIWSTLLYLQESTCLHILNSISAKLSLSHSQRNFPLKFNQISWKFSKLQHYNVVLTDVHDSMVKLQDEDAMHTPVMISMNILSKHIIVK